MRKQILSFTLVLFSLLSFAQSTYEKVMKEKIGKIETCKTTEDFQVLANDFQRIADKEKGKWQPNYYAAFSYIQKGRILMRENKVQGLDEVADQAQKYLDDAQNVDKNAETQLLQKMIYSLKMMVNPMERYMTYGTKATEQFNSAEKLDPNNPRIALIKAEDVYFTPEQYGGSKEKGIELFKQALEKFNSYKTKTDLDPNWGKSEAEYFINQAPK
ncbi:MAG: hypothetical protein K0R36_3053 [Chryseobacterium sp.]|jgi:hypothetical protein|nr:hypothetical protein [Chryseobacterium sp.]